MNCVIFSNTVNQTFSYYENMFFTKSEPCKLN